MKRIVLFSGGSACRTINIALSRRNVRLTRIVPAWDSGGSSKVIREKLGILSVGDIRQALMTMAHGEGCSGDVVRICNTRLSANRDLEEARKEFQFYAEGRHPLLERMEPGLRGAILNYLKTFASTVGGDFDFRNGSVGNFILTGACIAHNGDVNTAIFVFRKLCGISGNVWPSSLDSDLVLSARLKNGDRLSPQDVITKLSDKQAAIGIEAIELARPGGQAARPNPAAVEAIEEADLIAFGPGSFYTSILPHLLVDGTISAVERARCTKVMIGNILQCRETLGMTLNDVVEAFQAQWGQGRGDGARLSMHVLGNRVLFPFEKTVGAFPYLQDDLPEDGEHMIMRGELEDAWNRGQHDGDVIADRLLAIASNAAGKRALHD
ncbi:YvcK family protein [Rhizobium sp. XQZ8]|uniref:gluconeogenesis factor YvcK family protein n=1 Tax=Rhizobium populisoli TaxID=2859785 RepID=UPI001C67D37A|nr:gluconeogenesis factor YvcK family protein [Rhizobium populisoli]MBW6424996.1 YvcK family protein [Rhizobium populisoli]